MTTIDETLRIAADLDPQRLAELGQYTRRVRNGEPVRRPEIDEDPVLRLAKECVDLTDDELRRLNSAIGNMRRDRRQRLGGGS